MKRTVLIFATTLCAFFLFPSTSGAQTIAQAVQAGDTGQLNQLIASGANVNQADSNGVTPLMLAAGYGDVIMANQLVNAGAAVNTATSNGATALIIAAGDGYIDIVNLLLTAGANPNWQDSKRMRAYDYTVEANKAVLASETPRNATINITAVHQALFAFVVH